MSKSTDPEWPYQRFNEYLDVLLESAGVSTRSALAEQAGLSPSLFTKWKSGKVQPSRASLRKIAVALNTSLPRLLFEAGDPDDETDRGAGPDLSTLPSVYRRLIELDQDPRLSAAARDGLRSIVDAVWRGQIAQLEAEGSAGTRHS